MVQHHISLKNAWNGIIWSFRTQPNFKIHFSCAAIAIILGIILHISYVEMAIIILTIVFGLGVEMVNTSIEAMTDLITTEWRTEAKIAKDVAAGMMLLTAIGTVIVALFIFYPRIFLS